MKTRLFKTYLKGSPIYTWFEFDGWPFITPCTGNKDIRDTYHCYVWRNGRCHKGIDFIGSEGKSIYAVGAGTVIATGYDSIYGNNISIYHGKNRGYGLISKYAHLLNTSVEPGQIVEKNEQIGLMGSTGDSDSNHLHFEMRILGIDSNTRKQLPYDYAKSVDPFPFLPQPEMRARYNEGWQNERLPNDPGF